MAGSDLVGNEPSNKQKQAPPTSEPHHNSRTHCGRTSSGGRSTLLSKSIPVEFEIISQIGDGACGKVFKAKHRSSQKLVALKRLHTQDDGFVNEVACLRQLRNSEGIVQLFDAFIAQEDGSTVLAFEYMDLDLSGLLSLHLALSKDEIKFLFRQVLLATASCHRDSILHRDLKSSNLLVDRGGNVKLGDFGLAIQLEANPSPMSTNVVTLWYRAPELLLGMTRYDTAVDVWSLGCIFVELMTGKSPFPGRDEQNQLELIYSVCGSPRDGELGQRVVPGAPYRRRRLAQVFTSWSADALDLLDRFLQLDPKKRITVEDALRHEFFNLSPEAENAARRSLMARLENRQVHEYEVKQQRKELQARLARVRLVTEVLPRINALSATKSATATNGTVRTVTATLPFAATPAIVSSRKRERDEHEDSLSASDRPYKRARHEMQLPHSAQTSTNSLSSLAEAAYRPRPSDHCVRHSAAVSSTDLSSSCLAAPLAASSS